ncbi:hypothetical protein AVEN_190246-1 [Araneus ventricosus]|uniref:Uncharacterized protein n=1 Tax=Araneus ventricosus TaxID=182803 RepID=A0A4Y2M5M4_ARAVE|nr:hypothetical protein AVEN_190246-1 [Araneus ventricosus]
MEEVRKRSMLICLIVHLTSANEQMSQVLRYVEIGKFQNLLERFKIFILEFLSQPKPFGTPDGAARSGPAKHYSTRQHLAGAEFAQTTRHQNPQMQAQLYNDSYRPFKQK